MRCLRPGQQLRCAEPRGQRGGGVPATARTGCASPDLHGCRSAACNLVRSGFESAFSPARLRASQTLWRARSTTWTAASLTTTTTRKRGTCQPALKKHPMELAPTRARHCLQARHAPASGPGSTMAFCAWTAAAPPLRPSTTVARTHTVPHGHAHTTSVNAGARGSHPPNPLPRHACTHLAVTWPRALCAATIRGLRTLGLCCLGLAVRGCHIAHA